MLLNYELTTNLKIDTLMDLNKIKKFEESSNLKVNRSQLAREMNVDRRTISKYIQGYKKKQIVLEKVSLIPSIQRLMNYLIILTRCSLINVFFGNTYVIIME